MELNKNKHKQIKSFKNPSDKTQDFDKKVNAFLAGLPPEDIIDIKTTAAGHTTIYTVIYYK